MEKYNIILLNILCVLLCSCGKEKNNNNAYNINERLNFEVKVDSVLSEKIKSIDFLALDNVESTEIYDLDKVLFKNNYIYMADFHGHKIVVYDMSGKFQFVIDKKGAGVGEYLEIKNFTVDQKNIYIIDNYNHKIFMYDCQTGNFEGTKDLSFVAWDIDVLNNGDFIFAFVPLKNAKINMSQSNHLLFITDNNIQIKRRLFEYDKDFNVAFGTHSYFTSNEDNVVFSSLCFDGFTVVNKNNFDSISQVAIDFDHSIPMEKRNDIEKISERKYFYLSNPPILCKNYMAVQVNTGEYVELYVYDNKLNKFIQNSGGNATNFLYFPIASYKDKLVSYISEYSFYEELIAEGFQRADHNVEENLRNEGSMFVFYTMK